ncbi:VPA1267 family protein [Amphritea sp. 2_MG-2023]|uniref:VPA1267 family protein n=1 Tax=Amphritea TaxID=515417 RepID=UPI001C07A232|nr:MULTISPECIES: VPA1267 family protein [Amphritea]MBU2967224.1 hypothetical protein [Amphritea atlantica]MDO6420641.1 VPA1267 family protein [Amphritea sp. 2_MG-2023]
MSKEKGQQYFEMFTAWRDSMTDEAFASIVYASTGKLNKGQIKKLSGVSAEALKNNTQVKTALNQLEADLRKRGVLPRLTPTGTKSKSKTKLYDQSESKSREERMRIGFLEASNHDLKVKVAKLEAQVESLENRLAASSETLEAIDDLQVFRLCPAKS